MGRIARGVDFHRIAPEVSNVPHGHPQNHFAAVSGVFELGLIAFVSLLSLNGGVIRLPEKRD
jgi:hypothetical protein